uniref:Uncharacterized protein n=1 Tax=Anopheles minimus TaxID=112268 RepID=A0A182WMS3_9DIPT
MRVQTHVSCTFPTSSESL